MKLIDIDKVVSDYKSKNKNLQNVTWLELTDYEVKAIPIEWIEEYRQNRDDYADEYNAKAVLKRLLETWEKENEAN